MAAVGPSPASIPTPAATRIGDTAIALAWRAPPAAPHAQVLQVRLVPAPWERGRAVALAPDATSAEVGGLNPTASYEFRLQYTDAGGAVALGAGYAADTLPAGCGESSGDKKKGACAVA
jgi:hypothetical protein